MNRGEGNDDRPCGAGGFTASVVIPARNEGRVIGRTLRTLLDGGADDLEVIVVCNGCTDDTADVARAVSPLVRVVEIAEPSKAEALRTGARASAVVPRIYMDADVELTSEHVRALAAAVEVPGILAAAPGRMIRMDGVSHLVRWFYEVWAALPQVRNGLFGRGVIAVTSAGQDRLEAAPPLMSDDLVASEAFAAHERTIVHHARAVIRPPRHVVDLIRRRVRVATGVAQADLHGVRSPGSRTTVRTLAALIRREPRLLPRLPVFVGVTLLARLRAARRVAAGDFTTWQRDASSRM